MTTRLYNQKKHEQAKAFKSRNVKASNLQQRAKFDFLNPDVELNDEVDE